MKSPLVFVAACFALLAAYPWLGGAYGIDLVAKMMIYAIFALSLELLVGGTGLVCFGQAAFFGAGAYAAVRLSPADAPAALAWLLPASTASATPVANTTRYRNLMSMPSDCTISRLVLPARIIMPSRVRVSTRYMPIASTMHTAEMNNRYTG